jgi:hypothetical protein
MIANDFQYVTMRHENKAVERDQNKLKKVLRLVVTLIIYALLVVRKAARTACLQTDN